MVRPASQSLAERPLTIWALADGRPGHWNQVLGLSEAMARIRPTRMIQIPVPTHFHATHRFVLGRWPQTDALPDPDFILGAGHSTHLPLLTARRRRGGRTIVLMKPTLPVRLFDLCLIPETQRLRANARIIPTRGAVNRIQPGRKNQQSSLILIGGPSRHVRWESERVCDRVEAVINAGKCRHWTLTTSRRTPPAMLPMLRRRFEGRVLIHAAEDTTADWLPQRLAVSESVWVTADSVSMIFESLTARAGVGLLDVPLRNPTGKIARTLNELILHRDITTFSGENAPSDVSPPSRSYSEADRCAAEVLSRFNLSARAA